MEEREELPPANCIEGDVRVGESDCDATPHFIKERKPVEALENRHGLGTSFKLDASSLEKWLLLGDEFISVHGGQADYG